MTFRYKQFDIHQDHAAMKVGTDSDLLGTLSQGGSRILDIGTGTGVLSLMLAQRYPDALITAVEIDDNAIIDARQNFAESAFGSRITLHHASFQDFLKEALSGESQNKDGDSPCYDAIVCNPPYFDKSMECDDLSRTRARHTSSLPFSVLTQGAYALLKDGGTLSVCIPPEVLTSYTKECYFAGFHPYRTYKIKSIPSKPPKRYVLVHQKGTIPTHTEYEYCMRNEDRTRSDWYKSLMEDFLIHDFPKQSE